MSNWHIALVIVILLLFYIAVRQGFVVLSPLAVSPLPYTAGANIRTQSIDSATNRGFSSMPFI